MQFMDYKSQKQVIRNLQANIQSLLGFESCNIFLHDASQNCLYGVSVDK